MPIRYSSLSKVSIWILSIIMIFSMHPWFAWGNSFKIYLLIFLFILSRLPFLRILEISKKEIATVLVAVVMYLFLDLYNMSEQRVIFVCLVRHITLFIFVLLLTIDEKNKLVETLISIYTSILFITIVAFFLYLLGVDFPFVYMEYDPNYSMFRNYFFFTNTVDNSDPLSVYRFRSVFAEPGHMGMVSSFLMYVIGYKLKDKRTIVLLTSILLSFSLAAYILLIIGYILFKISATRNYIRSLFFLAIFLFGMYGSANWYYKNNPTSIFSTLILSRLEYDSEKGIVGNNRNTVEFNEFYSKFVKTPESLVGIGSSLYHELYSEGNSSYKSFIVSYGFLGLVLLFLLYVKLLLLYKSRFLIGFFLLYAASFIQRPYPLWEIELYLFICVSPFFFKISQNENKGLVYYSK